MPNLTARLLIVDDEDTITTALSAIFRGLGYKVQTAADGFSALRRLRIDVPDILLSDLNMPGLSGFELLSVVRRRFPEIYVIASSASFSGEEVPPGIAADAFHEKSTGLERLFSLVKAGTHKKHIRSGWDAATPIWISRPEADNSSMNKLPIACPECLRAFSLAPDTPDLSIKETSCVLCNATIRYAVVPRVGPAVTYGAPGRKSQCGSSFEDNFAPACV